METKKELLDILQPHIVRAEDRVYSLVNFMPKFMRREAQDKIHILRTEGVLHSGCTDTYHKDIRWEFLPGTSLDVANTFEFKLTIEFRCEIICEFIKPEKQAMNPPDIVKNMRSRGFSENNIILLMNELAVAVQQFDGKCFDIVIKLIEQNFGTDYRELFINTFCTALELRKTVCLKKELKTIARDLYKTRVFAKSKIIEGIRERIENLASS